MTTSGIIQGITSNLLMVKTNAAVGQNEICYVKHQDMSLMGEVIKIVGDIAYVQVFDSTRGLRAGTEVEFSGSLLEVELGPGILSKNYDGLQNDLDIMEGIFLKRGERTRALDPDAMWDFEPIAKAGDKVQAGDWLGSVQEKALDHKIMVPFRWEGALEVVSVVSAGSYKASDTIAVLRDEKGNERPVTMRQKWAVKVPLRLYAHKPRPSELLETGVRTIDSLHPMLEGGVGFVPGPFGAGKTVLQHALSKQAAADVVIVAACGERANEVVEIFTEFPHLEDTRTGGKLIDRTIIIANTSNMPVAAREASVYTAMTLGEYYRQMGLKVLLLADSTSRWAQALREMSNRLEDLPGPDAFPMDLSAIISNFYARAGMVDLNNGSRGSITFIGTVSPAGGNLKEPVTESTKKATRCFYALAQKRADSKRYPAIDPIMSYSKYLEYPEFVDYAAKNISARYVEYANIMKNLLLRGSEASDQINILGDDGVPLDYHINFWKSELIDFVVLQQDAFDKIDQMCPMHRQMELVEMVLDICERDFGFEHFEQVSTFYKKLINVFKQMNYSEYNSEAYMRFKLQAEEFVKEQIATINA
ncbi:MAG: V-type ATP synthase subunit A [Flavobacteriales bacterium]|nr:V-type ATP synthase subunit A [Flavobacteriales bacterium]